MRHVLIASLQPGHMLHDLRSEKLYCQLARVDCKVRGVKWRGGVGREDPRRGQGFIAKYWSKAHHAPSILRFLRLQHHGIINSDLVFMFFAKFYT